MSARPLFIYFVAAPVLVVLTTKGIQFSATNHRNLVRLWGGKSSELLTDVKGEALRAVHSCHSEHVVRQ